MAIDYLNPTGIQSYQNSLQIDGQLIHAVNVYSPGIGIQAKRPGYVTFLGTADGSQVNSLIAFPKQDGTTLWLYRASGSQLLYSQQGTGAWTLALGSAGGDGGGTITAGNHIGAAILNNVLIVGDGSGTPRTTTNGTQFNNASNSPVGAQHFCQYHQRVYATNGTTSDCFYSSYGSADNWSAVLPADSSSFTIPDEGASSFMFVAGDRLNVTKSKGKIFVWDETSLIDTTTKYGPTMPWSIKNIDDTWFYPNQIGLFQTDGATRTIVSNPVQRQFYNRQATGMGTTQIGTSSSACAETFIWDYLVTIGTITDDFVGRKIPNAILKYDFQKNVFHNWVFNDVPTAMLSYVDANNQKQFIFGNNAGQCFQLSQTATSDNGNPISSEMVFIFNYSNQQTAFSQTSASMVSGSSWQKRWKYLRAFFNPGCEINVQYAFSDTLTYQHLKWSDPINTKIGGGDFWQFSDGALEMRFSNDPNNLARSRFLFVRYYEDSDNANWTFYGQQVDAELQLIS